MIPKIIYQVYKTLDLPYTLFKNIEHIKTINPNWEYRLFDDNTARDFIAELYNGQYVDIYDRINPIYGPAKGDLFRYLVLYKTGGVYLDIKSTVNAPLDSFIKEDDQCILAHWSFGQDPATICNELRHIPDGEYVQWFMIYSQQHPFLKAVINRVVNNFAEYTVEKYGTGKDGVLRLSGPIPYTLAIEPILLQHKHRFIYYWDVGLQYSVVDRWESYMPDHYSTQTLPIIQK